MSQPEREDPSHLNVNTTTHGLWSQIVYEGKSGLNISIRLPQLPDWQLGVTGHLPLMPLHDPSCTDETSREVPRPWQVREGFIASISFFASCLSPPFLTSLINTARAGWHKRLAMDCLAEKTMRNCEALPFHTVFFHRGLRSGRRH